MYTPNRYTCASQKCTTQYNKAIEWVQSQGPTPTSEVPATQATLKQQRFGIHIPYIDISEHVC